MQSAVASNVITWLKHSKFGTVATALNGSLWWIPNGWPLGRSSQFYRRLKLYQVYGVQYWQFSLTPLIRQSGSSITITISYIVTFWGEKHASLMHFRQWLVRLLFRARLILLYLGAWYRVIVTVICAMCLLCQVKCLTAPIYEIFL